MATDEESSEPIDAGSPSATPTRQGQSLSIPQRRDTTIEQPTIRARRIELVDEHGNLRMTLDGENPARVFASEARIELLVQRVERALVQGN